MNCLNNFHNIGIISLKKSFPKVKKSDAETVGENYFQASVNWLDKFKLWHIISQKRVCGEGGTVDAGVITHQTLKQANIQFSS